MGEKIDLVRDSCAAFNQGAAWTSPAGIMMSRFDMMALTTQTLPPGFEEWNMVSLGVYFKRQLLKLGYNFADRNNPVLVQRVVTNGTVYLYFCQQRTNPLEN